jgi:hypothetical protein
MNLKQFCQAKQLQIHVSHANAAVGILNYARHFKKKPNLWHCSHVIPLRTKQISIRRTVNYAESRNHVLELDLLQGHRPRKRWWGHQWSFYAALTGISSSWKQYVAKKDSAVIELKPDKRKDCGAYHNLHCPCLLHCFRIYWGTSYFPQRLKLF